MTDNQTTEQAVAVFHNLSGDDTAKLKDFNARIQKHEGKWGVSKGGEKTASGAIQMPYIENDPLLLEFITFMYEKGLTIIFNWKDWDEGGRLYKSEDPTKYDDVDLATALKLITAVIRQDRFAEGSLAGAFESGGFPKLVNRLVALGAKRNE
jgi:hypothetical protein